MQNIQDIARTAQYEARTQKLIELEYTKQEAHWILAGRSTTDGSQIKQPKPWNPGKPDSMMRLYRKPEGGTNAPADAIAMREMAKARNLQYSGISQADLEDTNVAEGEARRACWRRAGLTFDELVAVGYMVIASERDGDGQALHGALLRLRIRDRIVREIARRRRDEYTQIRCGLLLEDGVIEK